MSAMPLSLDEIYQTAMARLLAGDSEEAMELALVMIKADRKDVRGWCVRADAFVSQESFKEAKMAMQRAIRIDAQHIAVLLLRARMALAQEQYNEAEDMTQQALALVELPEQERDVLLLQAEIVFQDANESYIQELSEMAKGLPSAGGVFSNTDEIDLETPVYMSSAVQSRFLKSLALAEQALAIDTESTLGWDLIARNARSLEDHERALEACKRSYALEPQNLDVLTLLSDIYLDLGLPEEAHDSLMRLYDCEIAELEPFDEESLFVDVGDFAEFMEQAWAAVEDGLRQRDDMQVSISLTIEPYPSMALMAESSPEMLIDPRRCFSCSFSISGGREIDAEVTVYQYNVERDMGEPEEGTFMIEIEEMVDQFLASLLDYVQLTSKGIWS